MRRETSRWSLQSVGLFFSLALVAAGCSVDRAPATAAQVDDSEPLTMVGNQRCGVERWGVKTGTDSSVGQVNLAAGPQDTTIAQLRAFAVPGTIPLDARVAPAETTVWRLTNVTLTIVKHENDSDDHLVLTDSAGNTMITEVPSPACVGSGSPFAAAIQAARGVLDGQTNTSGITVSLTGVGMFDFLHGQTGVAPNGIELHPVLSLCVGVDCMGGTTTTGTPDSGTTDVDSGVADAGFDGGSAQQVSSSVTFQVDNAVTTWGQNVYVVGDSPELGTWDVSHAIALSPTHYPTWTVTTSMFEGESVNFKFILIDGFGNVTWENGANRSWTVPFNDPSLYSGAWQP